MSVLTQPHSMSLPAAMYSQKYIVSEPHILGLTTICIVTVLAKVLLILLLLLC